MNTGESLCEDCGLAGYADLQIAPLFHAAPSNCHLPPEWTDYL